MAKKIFQELGKLVPFPSEKLPEKKEFNSQRHQGSGDCDAASDSPSPTLRSSISPKQSIKENGPSHNAIAVGKATREDGDAGSSVTSATIVKPATSISFPAATSEKEPDVQKTMVQESVGSDAKHCTASASGLSIARLLLKAFTEALQMKIHGLAFLLSRTSSLQSRSGLLRHGYARWQAIVEDKELGLPEVGRRELGLPFITLPSAGGVPLGDGASNSFNETPDPSKGSQSNSDYSTFHQFKEVQRRIVEFIRKRYQLMEKILDLELCLEESVPLYLFSNI